MKKLILSLAILMTCTALWAQKYIPPENNAEEFYKKYGINLFRNIEGIYFDLENDAQALGAITYLNILDWLQGRVTGLQIYRRGAVPVPFIRNRPAAIFVDELRMDPSVLNMIPVADIALIKVMRTPYVNMWNAPGGVIAVYTKRGEGDDEEEDIASGSSAAG